MKMLFVRSDVCSGCRACQVACVARHEGQFGLAMARIRIVKIEPEGLDIPHVCQMCRPPACAAACPTGALYLDETSGLIRLHAEECVACGECADACPHDMVIVHPATGQPQICDLCDGDPACVKRCAIDAIRYAEDTGSAEHHRIDSHDKNGVFQL